jgi:hypothetical protein
MFFWPLLEDLLSRNLKKAISYHRVTSPRSRARISDGQALRLAALMSAIGALRTLTLNQQRSTENDERFSNLEERVQRSKCPSGFSVTIRLFFMTPDDEESLWVS